MSETRAVSTTLGYVLSLAIATLLITGLIIAGGSYVETQRDQVIRDELTVVGQQLAADIERADRLVRAGDTDSPVVVSVNQTFSNSVTGSTYTVGLDQSRSSVVLNTSRPEVSVRVGVTTETDLSDSAVSGGTIRISYDAGDEHLEVQDV
ncbi:hypothetical protein NDI56_07180 [Haloarcula sp. S1CR25-12]|uniref:Flagellin n=1 Tax=Haloarcula saliterrae TaxID=2950534 RepID=A0ABU2FB78_9EURY|nr:hypothetical protein [Haloarcula sp. S1CR25-12]MDS0259173.1 hypothetical protein [Haloarcula sp. S1CR25-12]